MKWIFYLITGLTFLVSFTYSSYSFAYLLQSPTDDYPKYNNGEYWPECKTPDLVSWVEHQIDTRKSHQINSITYVAHPKKSCWVDMYLTNKGEACPDGEYYQPDGTCGTCRPDLDGVFDCAPPPPPENQCKMPAGEIIAANIEGVDGSESKFYCIDNCSAKPVKVGGPAGLCITFGDGIKRCTYDLISTGVDCDGTGDGTTDGDGNPTPNPVPDGEAPNDTGTGDGSVSGGDGSLEPDNPNDDDTGGTGDTNGDGEHTTSDTNGNLAKVVENTSNTVDGLQHNTNILSSKLDGIKDAIGNIPGGGGGSSGGTSDENADGVSDSVSGETCETFVCNGSATQCYIAKRLWEDKCGISNLFDTHENNITNTFNTFIEENKIEDIDAGTLDVSKYMNKFDSSNGVNIGGGGCPAPKTISVLDSDFTIDLNPFCDLAKIIKAFLLTFASFGVIMMISKYY